MALVDVFVSPAADRLPRDVRQFLRIAMRRIEEFTEATRYRPIPAFVPSDFTVAYRVLAAIECSALATGSLFCEWGSGFGVVTCLAALLEYEAYGIEIEQRLVAEAETLARDFDLPAEFVAGNFVPSSAETLAVTPGEVSWLATDGTDPYLELGLTVDDFDVIYAYPWPGEEDVLGRLFDRYAAHGALLVTYNGSDEVRVRRRLRPTRRTR